MKRYVKASKDYDERGIISSEGDMTRFIKEYHVVDTAIEIANDEDYNWKYNIPESFAEFAKEKFIEIISNIPDYSDGEFTVTGDPISLVSDEIWNQLQEAAMSGDFDVDDADDEIDKELIKLYDAQAQEIDEAVAKYHGSDSSKLTDALNRIEKKYSKLFRQAGYED